MGNVEFKFEIEADDDGYVSYECPFCKSTFSLNASEIQSDDPLSRAEERRYTLE